jgi:hypothetical protein
MNTASALRLAFACASLHSCLSLPPSGRRLAPQPPPLGAPIDRIGRALVANALLGPLAPDDVSDTLKEHYNRAAPATWSQFVPDFEATLSLYDGFDGRCGNQWLADPTEGPGRYRRLATLLADDRLWVDSRAQACTTYLAVERATEGCGGRTPGADANNPFRALLVQGSPSGIGDGVTQDDRAHSTSEFPFLAAP